MSVEINLFGSLRYTAGTSKTDIDLPSGSTVYEVLRFVADIFGKEFKEELFLHDLSSLRDDVTIIVNGMITRQSDILTGKINDGAIISLLPVFPGGG